MTGRQADDPHVVGQHGEQHQVDGHQGRVHAQVDQRRGAGVLHRVEGAQLQLVEAERHQADREDAQQQADEAGVGDRHLTAGEHQHGHLPAEHDEGDRRGDQHHGGQPQPPVERGAQVLRPAVGRRPGHARQQRGDDADRNDRVGQLPEHEGRNVGRVAATGVEQVLARGQVHDHDVGQLVGHDVEQHPLREPPGLAQAGPSQVEARPQRDPGRTQRRQQRDGLGHDPERRADPEQGDLPVGEAADADRLTAAHEQEDQAGRDHDQVVEHRRPHRRGVAAAGVQDRTEHGAGPVEQQLGQEEPGQQDREVARLG